MEIPEGNHTVFALEDIIFPDNTPVQVFAEIDDYLVAVAHFFAINNPLAGAVVRHPQTVINKCLQELCPEDFCQGLVAEEIPLLFHPPQTCFQIDAGARHEHMNVRVKVKAPRMSMEDGGKPLLLIL
jgi:hypothetical protein